MNFFNRKLIRTLPVVIDHSQTHVDHSYYNSRVKKTIDGISYTRLFVYGTLKTGFGRHNVLVHHGSKFLGKGTLWNHTMRYYPSFPAIYRGDHGTAQSGVVGEVWLVTDTCMERLDEIECVKSGLFHRDQVWISGHDDCIVYKQLMPTATSWEIVGNGVWDGANTKFYRVYLADVTRVIGTPYIPPPRDFPPPVVVPARPVGHKIERFIWPKVKQAPLEIQQVESK